MKKYEQMLVILQRIGCDCEIFSDEKGMKITMKDEESEDCEEGVKEEVAPDFESLRERAEKIGNALIDHGDKFGYSRRRYLVPGTRYKFYFLATNALNPKHPHRRQFYYYFQKDELALVEAWIKHDEDIYAEANQKYGVK